MTVIEALRSVNAYPIPLRTLVITAEARGLVPTDDVSADILKSKMYNLALADLLMWLSTAPDVSQGGQNYSFTDEQRKQFRNRANSLYDDFGADDGEGKSFTIPRGYWAPSMVNELQNALQRLVSSKDVDQFLKELDEGVKVAYAQG